MGITADTDELTADSDLVSADGRQRPPPPPFPLSGFVRRSGDDYADSLAALLPTGPAWPRDPKSALMLLVAGLGQVWGNVDGRAADLLETETDPRQTLQLLAEWERAFGLPDPCVTQPLTIPDRRTALLNKMTALGAQSRAFFIGIAAALGYSIQIVEWSPVQCGVSYCGDTRPYAGGYPWFRVGEGGGQVGVDHLLKDVLGSITFTGPHRWYIGPQGNRAWWRVLISGRRLSWFRMGTGQMGVDPMVRFMPAYDWFRVGDGGGRMGTDHMLELERAEDLECVFRRCAPAHTILTFDYSGQPASAY